MMPPRDYPEADNIEDAVVVSGWALGICVAVACLLGFLLGFGAGLLFGAIW